MDENFLVKKTKKEEEKRKKRGFLYLIGIKNTRLAFLIIAFVLTLIGLSTSTYAWFTSNQTVSVQEIDVNVSSGSGIQISTDAVNWKSMITVDDITDSNLSTFAVNQVPTTSAINPVSTVEEVYATATSYSYGLHMFKGTIVNDVNDGTMYLNSTEEIDGSANPNYVAFDLYLKLDFKETDDDKQIYFTSGTGITAGNPNTSIEYAGRMGFVVQGTEASSSAVNTLRGIKGNEGVYIYEPNYDVHTSNGLANGRDNYNITGYNTANNATAVPYYGLISAFAYNPEATPEPNTETNPTITVLGSHDPAKFDEVDPTFKTRVNNNANFEFVELPVGVTKIRVYMWVEGQDIDCENTASGGRIKFNLGFTLEAPPTAAPSPTSTPEQGG